VFLLRDVFDYGYDEIAEIVGKSEANCRQILVRARRRVDERKPRFDVSPEHREQLARRFIAAFESGETQALVDILAADVVFYGDGGGRVAALPEPLSGRDRVVQVLSAFARQAAALQARAEPVIVNGQPGVVFRDSEGALINVVALDIAGGAIHAVRSVVNPDKLRHLGRVADVTALLRGRRRTS
jgi:RNA polymerase sigma-70 factor (ECF subfamily)